MTTFIIKMKVGVNRLKILMSDRDIASRLATWGLEISTVLQVSSPAEDIRTKARISAQV